MHITRQLIEERTRAIVRAFSLSEKEIELSSSLTERLPRIVIDAHLHCAYSSDVLEMSDKAYGHMISTFPFFTCEESQMMNILFYPSVEIRSLRFGMVFKGVDFEKMNNSLVQHALPGDRVALYGTLDNPDYVINELSTGKFAALKMYYSYPEENAKTIIGTFSKKILRFVEAQKIPIICHLPFSLDEEVEDILELQQAFPNLRMTICHLGSTEVHHGERTTESFRMIGKNTEFMMDCSLNHNKQSMRDAIEFLGPNRVMYGTDAPYNLFRSVVYEHPEKGKRIVTSDVYHWTDLIEYSKYAFLAKNAIHEHWAVLSALLDEIDNFDIPGLKDKIFFENANSFYWR